MCFKAFVLINLFADLSHYFPVYLSSSVGVSLCPFPSIHISNLPVDSDGHHVEERGGYIPIEEEGEYSAEGVPEHPFLVDVPVGSRRRGDTKYKRC